MPRDNLRHVAISGELYRKITKTLPRTNSGKVRPGALKDRMDALINAALDQEKH